MKIFNIMMSRSLGGIQQAFLDYNRALSLESHDVINITSNNAKINELLDKTITLPNIASWCPISRIYLRILIAKHKPDIIICHGNRAISFANAFKSADLPLIGVSHNYSFKHLKKCDYILTLTDKLKKHLIDNGLNSSKLLSIPNMISVTKPFKKKLFQQPLVIGSFGRFVTKKGFIHLIESIKLLKQGGNDIKLLLGGDGSEKANLLQKAKELDLEDNITFVGWVKDKDRFFQQIDIFCLPSIEEPFGIILLEAMEHSTPIVSTKSGGPEEILIDKKDGLVVKTGSSSEIAKGIKALLEDQTLAQELARNAYSRLTQKYDINIVSKELSTILNNLIKK